MYTENGTKYATSWRLILFIPVFTFIAVLVSSCVDGAGVLPEQIDFGDDDDDSMILSRSHDGWKGADCWESGCHSPNIHNSGLDPYECAECHGGNGAGEEHYEDMSCNDCHPEVADHPSDSFPNDECDACHD